MFEGPEIHSSGVPAVLFPQYFDPLVVASALPGPASSSRSVFSFPAPTLPVNPPGCLPVWLPYLWISLAQSPGLCASFSSPPQPRPPPTPFPAAACIPRLTAASLSSPFHGQMDTSSSVTHLFCFSSKDTYDYRGANPDNPR